jgi:hypothetical protein
LAEIRLNPRLYLHPHPIRRGEGFFEDPFRGFRQSVYILVGAMVGVVIQGEFFGVRALGEGGVLLGGRVSPTFVLLAVLELRVGDEQIRIAGERRESFALDDFIGVPPFFLFHFMERLLEAL